MADAIAEAPTAAPVTAPIAQQPPISMSFMDKVAAAADKPKPAAPAKEPAKETAKVEVPKVETKPDAKGEKKVEAPTKEAAKAPDKKATDSVDESKIDWKSAPQHFRQSHERALAELKELKSKPAPKVDEIPEYKELSAKVAAKEKELAEIQKRAEELESTIRYVDYEKSPEFQSKYQKPWIDTYTEGLKEVTQLSVPLEEGGTRKATKKEFDAIVTNPDVDSAIEMAEKLFNNATRANVVLDYRKRFLAANKAMEDAKREYREKGVELEKQTNAQREEARRQEIALWEQSNKDWAEKNADLVKVEEGDEDGAKAFELGNKAADMAFGDTSNLDPAKRAKLFSDTRNRAAAFGVVKHKLTKAEARIAELEEKLKGYEDSVPAGGEQKKDAPVAEETFAQRLQKAAR